MIKVNHFRNSFIEVVAANKKLWCDPWLSDANNGDWLRADISFDEFCNRFGYPDYVYISHIHNDHFDISFLRYLSNYKDFIVILGDQYESLRIINKRLLDEGVITPDRYVALNFYQPKQIEAFSLTLLPDNQQSSRNIYPLDTSLMIEVENIQIYNQTDNIVSVEILSEYKNKYKNQCNRQFLPDLSFLPYCGASAYPQSYIGIDRTKERERLIQKLFKERFTDIALDISSGNFFPAGGTYSLRDNSLDPYKVVPNSAELTNLSNSCGDYLKQHIIDPSIGVYSHPKYTLNSINIGDSPNSVPALDKKHSADLRLMQSILKNAADQLQSTVSQTDVCISLWVNNDHTHDNKVSESILLHNHFNCIEILTLNHSCHNHHKVYIPERLFVELLGGTPWNAAYFGVLFERFPNIYNPYVDTVLSLLFAQSSKSYRSTISTNCLS